MEEEKLTEEEAKTKWCPMVRLHAGNGAVCNVYSDGDIPEFSNCIASDCMMWREKKEVTDMEDGRETKLRFHGYCGLANMWDSI